MKFNVRKNILSDVLTLVMLIGYSISFVGYQIPDIWYTSMALSYVLLTLYDVGAIVKYIKDPEMFLKCCKVNHWTTYALKEKLDATVDYFKYFKKVRVGEYFIVYDSLFGQLKYIITDQYYIRKQSNYSGNLSDKLFHVVEKEIQYGRFTEFFNLSQRYLDEHTNVDKYAMFNLGTIQNYLKANHMEYNDLTDDDLKVIEMYQY